MALPGANRGAVFATHKISIGEVVQKGDKTYPRAMDYFTVRYYDNARDLWLVNETMQERLRELTGQEKPQFVPVLSPYNSVEQAVFTELAAWASGGRNVCRCGRFAMKTAATCEEQGLRWPPAQGVENAGDEYYCGTAVRTIWRPNAQGFPEPVEKRTLTCDPHTCPFRTGNWNHEGRAVYKDVYGKWPSKPTVENSQVLCHPHCVVKLLLPWVGDESPRAKFTTPSWYSALSLTRTWSEIRDMAGGMIAGIPLKLVVQFPRIMTPRGMQNLPIVHFEPAVPWRDLPVLGEAKAAALKESVSAQLTMTAHQKMLDGIVEEDEAAHVAAFLREHEVATGETGSIADFMEERFRAVAAAAGWTAPAIDSFVAEASPEELVRQIAAMEQPDGREGQVSDVEFSEDPEGEYEPSEYDLDAQEQGQPRPPAIDWSVDEEDDPFPNAPETRARRLIPEEE